MSVRETVSLPTVYCRLPTTAPIPRAVVTVALLRPRLRLLRSRVSGGDSPVHSLVRVGFPIHTSHRDRCVPRQDCYSSDSTSY
ncbi:MAG: hypothetical protein ACR2M3_19670 [Thermomicrobiales bacterium]